jgi:RNA polymerase sigma-70 factor (ECF subfamily)
MMLRDPYRAFGTVQTAAAKGGSLPVDEGTETAGQTVEKATRGTETPLGRLRQVVDQHYDALWRTLRYLGIPEASVDDAAQRALCILARRLDDIVPGSERSFLFATAIRVASDARRAARRNPSEPAERIDAFPAAGSNPEELLDQRRAQETLREIVNAMPPDLAAVFVLFEIEELTLSEIAGVLGIPTGTAASRLRRARASFHAIVKRRQASERTGSPWRRP